MMKFNIGTPREATGPNAGTRFFGCPPQLIHYQDRQDPYRASSVWGKTETIGDLAGLN